MGDSWQDKHRNHALWETTRETLAELEASYSEDDHEDFRYWKLKDLLAYVLGFEDTPHPTITELSLQYAHDRIEQIGSGVADRSAAFQSPSGANSSQFQQLAAQVRSWPQPGAGRLTGLGRQVESLEGTLRASETRMLNAVTEHEEALEKRRAEDAEVAAEHLQTVTKDFAEVQSKLMSDYRELAEEFAHTRGRLEASEKTLDNHIASFEDAFKEHGEELKRNLDEATTAWASQLHRQQEEAEEQHSAMKDYRDKSANILAVVGTNSTATEYGTYAYEEAQKADTWRNRATWAFLIAAIVFVIAMGLTFAGVGADSHWWEVVVQRIGAPAGVAGIGLFMSRESGLHRKVARSAKQTELTLHALEPFIVNMPDEQQKQIRYETARALFSRSATTLPEEAVSDHDEPVKK